jgi:hypothetical protein
MPVRSIVLRLGFVAAIVVGALIYQLYISKGASDLRVGDCFDLPSADVETVQDVKPHPCADAHYAEVVYVGDYSGDASTYPTRDTFQQFFVDACLPAYTTYTGTDIVTTTDMDMGFLYPTPEGWGQGDRKVTCYAYKADASTVTGTIRKK